MEPVAVGLVAAGRERDSIDRDGRAGAGAFSGDIEGLRPGDGVVLVEQIGGVGGGAQVGVQDAGATFLELLAVADVVVNVNALAASEHLRGIEFAVGLFDLTLGVVSVIPRGIALATTGSPEITDAGLSNAPEDSPTFNVNY